MDQFDFVEFYNENSALRFILQNKINFHLFSVSKKSFDDLR